MLANSGTPLMWFGVFYLTFANVLLGLFEGAVIAAVCRVGYLRSIGWMTIANFVSSWAGAALVGQLQGADITIANLHTWLWSGLAGLIVLTPIVELPFVREALSRATWRRALRVTLGVHALSYPPLIVFAWSLGDWSVLQWTVVPAAKIAQPMTYVVFYVDRETEDVWRRDLAMGGDTVVAKLPAPLRGGSLFLQPESGRTCSLHVWLDGDASATVLTGLSDLVAPEELPAPRAFVHVPSLDPESPWRFQVRYAGLVCEGPGVERELAPQTALTKAWWPTYAIHVAGDLAVVRFADQIYLLKASTGEIALVARGRGAAIAAVRR